MWSYNTHHFHIHCLASIFICLERLHVCHIKFYISDKNRNWNFKLNFPFAPRKGIGCNPLSRITGAVAFQKISYPFISQIFSSSPFLIESSHLERQTANVLFVHLLKWSCPSLMSITLIYKKCVWGAFFLAHITTTKQQPSWSACWIWHVYGTSVLSVPFKHSESWCAGAGEV